MLRWELWSRAEDICSSTLHNFSSTGTIYILHRTSYAHCYCSYRYCMFVVSLYCCSFAAIWNPRLAPCLVIMLKLQMHREFEYISENKIEPWMAKQASCVHTLDPATFFCLSTLGFTPKTYCLVTLWHALTAWRFYAYWLWLAPPLPNIPARSATVCRLMIVFRVAGIEYGVGCEMFFQTCQLNPLSTQWKLRPCWNAQLALPWLRIWIHSMIFYGAGVA